jgi:hypothetical protein
MILDAQFYAVRSFVQTRKDIRHTLIKIAEMEYKSVRDKCIESARYGK